MAQKFIVYPHAVYLQEDFDEMCGNRDLPPGMSDDYEVVDTDPIIESARVALNCHNTPEGWRLIRMETTSTRALESGEDPITRKVFEVPLEANGLSFIAICSVTYAHAYHSTDFAWWISCAGIWF